MDGDISGNISSSHNIDNSSPGSYLVSYSVGDSSGNTATASRTVEVVDTTAPTLTLLGNNLETIEVHTTYTDAGVLCHDNYDTSCSSSMIGSINTAIIGTGTLSYSANDISGNISLPIIRNYEVVRTAPSGTPAS